MRTIGRRTVRTVEAPAPDDSPFLREQRRPEDQATLYEERYRRPVIPLLIAFLIALFCVWYAGHTAARMWLEDLDARLVDAGAGTNALVTSTEAKQLTAYRSIAFTDGFPDVLEHYDAQAISRVVTPVEANQGVPMVDIIDTRGRVVFAFRADDQLRPRYQTRSDIDIVDKALAGGADEFGERFSTVITTPKEGALLATAGPIRNNGHIVGALLLMTPLDRILAQGADVHGARLTVYSLDRGDAMATTAPVRVGSLTTSQRAKFSNVNRLPSHVSFSIHGKKQREIMSMLVVRHQPAALLGSSLRDRSWQVAFRVWVIAGLGMLLVPLLVGLVVHAWTKREYELEVPPPPPLALPAAAPPVERTDPTGARPGAP